MVIYLSRDKLEDLMDRVNSKGLSYDYEYRKHRLAVFNQDKQIFFHIRLPIDLRYPNLTNITSAKIVILLIQAGHGALGYLENENLIDHKMISTYMIRKKQGKSQIKFLKTKGKSRAGSRIRLANTIRFFEHINLRLQGYFESHVIDRIAMSCSKTLIPYLFNSKVKCPFHKKDERIYMIPRDIRVPNFKVLQDTCQFLLKGEIRFESPEQKLVNELLA